MSHPATVHQLESDFADAMTRLYAVGNGLARLRAELDREAVVPGTGTTAHPATGAPGIPVGAPGSATGTPGIPVGAPGSATGAPFIPTRVPAADRAVPSAPATRPDAVPVTAAA